MVFAPWLYNIIHHNRKPIQSGTGRFTIGKLYLHLKDIQVGMAMESPTTSRIPCEHNSHNEGFMCLSVERQGG